MCRGWAGPLWALRWGSGSPLLWVPPFLQTSFVLVAKQRVTFLRGLQALVHEEGAHYQMGGTGGPSWACKVHGGGCSLGRKVH